MTCGLLQLPDWLLDTPGSVVHFLYANCSYLFVVSVDIAGRVGRMIKPTLIKEYQKTFLEADASLVVVPNLFVDLIDLLSSPE